MVEDKSLKAYKAGQRSAHKSKHRHGHKRYSILEIIGAGTGALAFMGSGDSAMNGLQNLKDFQNGGLDNIGYNMGANLNLPSAVKVAIPVALGFIGEKVLQKMHLNIPISRRFKL